MAVTRTSTAPPAPIIPSGDNGAQSALPVVLGAQRFLSPRPSPPLSPVLPVCTHPCTLHAYHPTPQEEKAQYDLHENDPHDLGYRKFLSRLTDPLLAKLPPHSYGLDYGCGPGPTLSVMMHEAGHSMALHDPIYHPNPDALSRSYQFITATEVFEHLHQPARDLDSLHHALQARRLARHYDQART